MKFHYRMDFLKLKFAKRTFVLSFLFAWNVALTAYINSTFLGNVLSAELIGFVFALGAILTLIGLEWIPNLLKKEGNVRTTSLLILLSVASLLGLHMSETLPVGMIVFLFVIYNSTNSLVAYCFDLFFEHFSHKETVGRERGLYLTVTNFAWLLAPLLSGFLISNAGFTFLYGIVGIIVSITGIIVVTGFKNFVDPNYDNVPVFKLLFSFDRERNILHIITINFLLQFFYAWMVVYTPLYLSQELGLSFGAIGIIFTIMLLPFVLIQFPVGWFADKLWGEKELLAIGFLIIVGSTLAIPYVPNKLVLLGGILFLTRVGASMIEVMSETYFFKKVNEKEPKVLSLYRLMTPVAFILGPISGGLIIHYFGFEPLFAILASLLLIGIILSLRLHDTK